MKLNKKRVLYAALILIEIILLGALGFKIYNDFKKPEEPNIKTNLDNISLYGYTLDDRDTEIYTKYFKELKKILNKDDIDKEEYASILTKLFIIDLYTLSNKLTSTDIGGLEFVHNDLVENFKLNIGDTMYHNIESNLSDDRTQELPEVKDVEIIDISEHKYTYNKKEYDGYIIEAKWEYIKDMGYETEGKFIVIYDNNKINMVEKVKEN